MAPKIRKVETGDFVSLADFDNIICQHFNKDACNLAFSDEYHMLMGIAEVIYRDGKWSCDLYDHVMARLEVCCGNKLYFDLFKQAAMFFLKDTFEYRPDDAFAV